MSAPNIMQKFYEDTEKESKETSVINLLQSLKEILIQLERILRT